MTEFAMVFAIIGAVLLFVGCVFIIPWKVVSRFSGETTGTITDMTRNAVRFNRNAEREAVVDVEGEHSHKIRVKVSTGGNDTSNTNMYYPIYKYSVNGREYCNVSGVAYNKGNVRKKIGKNVPVYYDVEKPECASLSNGKGYKIISLGLIMGGVVIGMAGLIFMWLA